MSKFPTLPDEDSIDQLQADLAYGGLFGYAMSRGAYDNYPSTLEFEDAILRDVMNRSIKIGAADTEAEVSSQESALKALCNRTRELLAESFAIANALVAAASPADVPNDLLVRMNTLYQDAADLGFDS